MTKQELGEYAWYRDNSDGQTKLVGQKKPNLFNLSDINGNVWEWVEDCYKDNYDGVPADGSALVTLDCKLRVLRGGCWALSSRVSPFSCAWLERCHPST